MSRRPDNPAQADLFIGQGDLFASVPTERSLPRPTHLEPGESTRFSLMGETLMRIGQRRNNPRMAATGLRLLRRKLH